MSRLGTSPVFSVQLVASLSHLQLFSKACHRFLEFRLGSVVKYLSGTVGLSEVALIRLSAFLKFQGTSGICPQSRTACRSYSHVLGDVTG